MRTLARAAAGSLASLCVALAFVAVAVAAIGIAGTRSAASQGNAIAEDELTTAVVTGRLARDIDAAYAAGQAVVLATDQAERARLLGTLYTSLLHAVDARLFALERLHAARSEEHTSELQSRRDLVCRLLLEKKNKQQGLRYSHTNNKKHTYII